MKDKMENRQKRFEYGAFGAALNESTNSYEMTVNGYKISAPIEFYEGVKQKNQRFWRKAQLGALGVALVSKIASNYLSVDNIGLEKIITEVASMATLSGAGVFLFSSFFSYLGAGFGMESLDEAMKQNYILDEDEKQKN